MKHTLKTKHTQFARISAVTQIISLCLDIHNAGLATVFIDVSGHIGELSVGFHIGGWVAHGRPDQKIRIYIGGERYDPTQAAALIVTLNKVLTDRVFPESFQ